MLTSCYSSIGESIGEGGVKVILAFLALTVSAQAADLRIPRKRVSIKIEMKREPGPPPVYVKPVPLISAPVLDRPAGTP